MSLSAAENIQILLHEYDTLRNELISRHASMFQSVSIGATVLIGLIALQATNPISWWIWNLLFFFGLFLFGLAMVWIDHDVYAAAARLQQLEREVNTLAGTHLLRWESEHGLGGVLWKLILWVRNLIVFGK